MSARSPSQQPTALFSIDQNNTWTIKPLVNETIHPANHQIILKIFGFHISMLNPTDEGTLEVAVLRDVEVL